MPAELYRWSREETEELLKSTNIQELLKKPLRDDEEAEDLNVLLAEALERSEIPDKYGRWRPRSTKRYIMTGDRPTAPPIPGPSAGSAGTTSASVWVRELARNKDRRITAKSRQEEPEAEDELEPAFKVQSGEGAQLNDVDDLKTAIKQTNPDLKDIAPRHIDIYLYSQEAGAWQRIKDESEVLRRDTTSKLERFATCMMSVLLQEPTQSTAAVSSG
eukprot:s8756_g1.t1